VKLFRLFVISLLLTGCATLSQEECQHGDWHSIGIVDGQAGEPASRFDEHTSACSEYGIKVDKRQYFNGRTQGLIDYCQIDNAFNTGIQGHQYQHVCPSSIDAVFDRYNGAAYEVYQTRKEIQSVEYQIQSKENELQKKDLSNDNRHRIRSEIRDLDYRHGRLEGDLHFKERSLDRMMDEAR
jgi:hypothetical protein